MPLPLQQRAAQAAAEPAAVATQIDQKPTSPQDEDELTRWARPHFISAAAHNCARFVALPPGI
jgi:hypothetical protein